MLTAVAGVLATASSSVQGFEPMAWLVAQGPLGIICAGLLFALKRESKRADTERARADGERAGKDLLVERFLTDLVPALSESTSAQRELLELRRRGK